MNMPGFTAEASLYKTSGRYQPVGAQGYSNGEPGVISQLGGGRFPGSHGLGTFGDFGRWLCRFWCEITYSSCLDGCEGGPGGPMGSMHCTICDQTYRACVQGCG